jgi:hypothetical protein
MPRIGSVTKAACLNMPSLIPGYRQHRLAASYRALPGRVEMAAIVCGLADSA